MEEAACGNRHATRDFMPRGNKEIDCTPKLSAVFLSNVPEETTDDLAVN